MQYRITIYEQNKKELVCPGKKKINQNQALTSLDVFTPFTMQG